LDGQMFYYCSHVNMITTLAVCSKEERCAVIWFLSFWDVPGSEVHQRLAAQCGNSAWQKQCLKK